MSMDGPPRRHTVSIAEGCSGQITERDQARAVDVTWCWWFRKYAPSNTELEGFEQAARQARKGSWSVPKPVPPWEYRKAQRGQPDHGVWSCN